MHRPQHRRRPSLLAAATVAFLSATAAADVTVVDFDYYPDGSPVLPADLIQSQWSTWGVVFSNAAGEPINVSNNACSLSPPNHAYATTVVARFVDTCSGSPALVALAGTAQDTCWFPGEGIVMRAYDANGTLIASALNQGSGNRVVFAFSEPVIARLEMDCVLQGIDDFEFDRPVAIQPADLNGDGSVSGADLGILLGTWGVCTDCCPADVNRDGEVNGADLGILLAAWSG